MGEMSRNISSRVEPSPPKAICSLPAWSRLCHVYYSRIKIQHQLLLRTRVIRLPPFSDCPIAQLAPPFACFTSLQHSCKVSASFFQILLVQYSHSYIFFSFRQNSASSSVGGLHLDPDLDASDESRQSFGQDGLDRARGHRLQNLNTRHSRTTRRRHCCLEEWHPKH